MASAFQSNAFQNNAFQIAVAVATVAVSPGGSISGGHFSRGRWHDLKQELALARRHRFEEERDKQQRKLTRVADELIAKVERRLKREDEKAATVERIWRVAEALALQDSPDDEHAMALLLLSAEPDADKRKRKAKRLIPADGEDDELALLLLMGT